MTKFIDLTKEGKEERDKYKNTVFFLYFNNHKWTDSESMPNDYDKVIFLGYEKQGNIYGFFACYKENENIVHIYKGIKGDEFD